MTARPSQRGYAHRPHTHRPTRPHAHCLPKLTRHSGHASIQAGSGWVDSDRRVWQGREKASWREGREATMWGRPPSTRGSPPGSAHPAVQPHSPYRSCHLATTNRAASRGGDGCCLEVKGGGGERGLTRGAGGPRSREKTLCDPLPSPHPQHTPPTPTPASTLVPAEHERAQAKLGGGAGAGVGVWWEGEGGSERKGQQGSGGWLEQDVLGGH